MAKKKTATTKRIANRKARFDYALEDGVLAGVALTGAEAKSLRIGLGHIRGAYVVPKNDELWLINATITGNGSVRIDEDDYTRPRKLLLKKREINALLAEKDQGKTIVPLEILTQGRYIKVRIAAGRGKKKHDKRQTIKKRETDRQNRREFGKI